MPILADLHLHSSYSSDSQAKIDDMIQSAISKGLQTICFTEHMDLEYPIRDDQPEGFFTFNSDAFLYELLTTRKAYEDKIEVLFGLEIGMQPHLSRENARVVKDHEYDFIIGSVHLLDGKDPYYADFHEGKTPEEVLRAYFEETYKNIRSFGNFDSLGHLDYIVRYCKLTDNAYSYAKYQDILDKILEFLVDREKALELNTAPLRKGFDHCNPTMEVLKRFKQLGGEAITIGSDAHTAADIASGFDQAAELLETCGYKYYSVYSGRIPMMKKL